MILPTVYLTLLTTLNVELDSRPRKESDRPASDFFSIVLLVARKDLSFDVTAFRVRSNAVHVVAVIDNNETLRSNQHEVIKYL